MPSPKAPWRAPRIWAGGDCFILGGGPGLRSVDIERLRGAHVIAVNQAYELGDWFDVLFFGDHRWYQRNRHALLDFAGLKVTTCEQERGKPGIKWIKRHNVHGLSRDPIRVCWNLSSGAAAINLAYHLGARRIILLGFDMRRVDNQANWHKKYLPENRKTPKNPYKRFMGPFKAIANNAEHMGLEIINATPGSALGFFPIVDPEGVYPKPATISEPEAVPC